MAGHSVESIMKELQFQRTGLTDSDTIAELGKQMNADYVVSGHIALLGDANLLLISIVSVETMEQIAGAYREYGPTEEIHRLLPSMAANIVASFRQNASAQKQDAALAVLPLNIQDQDIKQDDAELLALMLSIEIANIHRYRVLPRTRTIEDIMKEQEIQRSGLTSRESMAEIGKATNARYVLAGTITRLGNDNFFDAKILEIETGRRIAGQAKKYQNLDDGIEIMRILARDLTGITEEEEAARREAEAKIQNARLKLFSLGAAAGSTFAAPWLVITIGGTASLWPYTFFDAGLDIGFIHGYEGRGDVRYFSLYPYAHFNGYLPIGRVPVIGNILMDRNSPGGLYLGVGMGLMAAFYETGDEKNRYTIPTAEVTTGLYLGRKNHYCRIAYTLRTPFEQFFGVLNHKLTLGYSYRWE
jgi:TolB-like protein